jgi:ATP-dependent protease ClpP protease subunit
MASRSGKPLRQIIRDTKRTDFYLDAWKAREYGLIDRIIDAALAPERDEAIAAEEAAAPILETSTGVVSIHGRSDS